MTVDVRAIRATELDLALPLIAAYQGFYESEADHERNRAFFARFVAPSDDGLLLGAWEAGALVGFATLYWMFSSTAAAEIVLMNDLFVAPGQRGRGIGRALIDASLDVTRARGAHHLEWLTAPDNRTAQRLYDSMGATRTEWITYELEP